MSLTTTIRTIQDTMRKDAGVDGDAKRIGQLGWLLFLKLFDDQEQGFELTHDDYRSPIPERLRWSRWAADPEGITGGSLHDLFEAITEQRLALMRQVAEMDRANVAQLAETLRQTSASIQRDVEGWSADRDPRRQDRAAGPREPSGP